MTDVGGNGQGIPMADGLPIMSVAVPWQWQLHKVGRDDNTGENVFLLRIVLQTGPLELWAPASFIREMGEQLCAQAAGLSIARDFKPPTQP